MYFCDDSIYYETTYSQDERIGTSLQNEKEEETAKNKLEELKRKQEFYNFFEEQQDHDIFNLSGLKFLKFTHLKIKFSFEPSKVVTHVRQSVIFYCSLKYYDRYKLWNIRRDSFPVNYKWRIYRLFYHGDYLAVSDDSIINVILKIYAQLKIWAQGEEAFRLEKFMRYQEGEEVILDSDDEYLFLNEDQRTKLHKKREKILKRMLPPSHLRKKRIRPKYILDSESE